MNTPNPAHDSDKQALCELVLLALDKRLDEQQRSRLNDLLRRSETLREHYLECLAVQVGMKRLTHLIESGLPQSDLKNFDSMLWQALAEDERTAETVVVAPEPQPSPLIQKVQRQKVAHRISKLPLTTALISMAAMLMMIAYVMLNPRPHEKPIAVITEMVNAQWTDTDSPPRIGHIIYNTTYDLHLASGVVKLKYDSGAEAMGKDRRSFLRYGGYDAFERRQSVRHTAPRQPALRS
jgi:hypothetical protein